MDLSGSNIKKCLIFSQNKAFLMFWETEIPKFLIFQETEHFYISRNGHPKKLLIFQEVTLRAQKIKKPCLKNALYFRKWNFLASRLQTLLNFRR